MSLEWARARLLQHREEVRKLCEAQAAAQRVLRAVERQKRLRAAVVPLRPDPVLRPAAELAESGTVLPFAQPRRRRQA
jgi:hypothetical protein